MKIAAAAIKDHDGTVYQIPPPGRHHNVIRMMADAGRPTPITGTQGFVTSAGDFVERDVARTIAVMAGQLLPRASGGRILFSEDVW